MHAPLTDALEKQVEREHWRNACTQILTHAQTLEAIGAKLEFDLVQMAAECQRYRTALEMIKSDTTDPDIQDLCDDALTDSANVEVPT
jgi:hypothetical protein